MTWEKQIVLAGYRRLTLRHHPDKGGKDDDFKSLVAARDRLLAFVNAVEGTKPVAIPWQPPAPVRAPQTPEELLARILNVAEAFISPKPKRRRR